MVVATTTSAGVDEALRAVAEQLTAETDQLADAITVYPSMSGTIAEVARMLNHRPVD